MENEKKEKDFVKIITEANTNFENRRYEDAVNEYSKVLEMEPENVKAIFRLGLSKTLVPNNLCNIDFLRQALDNVIGILKKDNNSGYNDIVNSFISESNYYLYNLVLTDERFFMYSCANYYQLSQFYANLQKVLDLLFYFERNLVNAKKNDYLSLYSSIMHVCNSINTNRQYMGDFGVRYTYMITNKSFYTYQMTIYQNKYNNLYYSNYY